jgi:hypothetical protein
MRVRGFCGVVLLAVAALAAMAPSAALATATTTKAQWKVGATESSISTLVGSAPLTVTLGKNPTVGETFVMETTVPGSAIPINTVFGKVSCSECVITNEDPEHPGVAIGRGKLIFSNGAIGAPWNCTIEGGKAESSPLIFEGDYMEEGKWLMKIRPASGELVVGIFPKNCSLGNFPVKGANFGKFINKTGVFATSQTLEFSPSISTAAGSSWFVSESMTMRTTGTLVFKTAEAKPFFGME